MKIGQAFAFFRAMNIRMKLICSFFLMVVMIAGAGSSGLFFINLIRKNVETISDIASPLASVSNALVNEMLTANTIVLNMLAASDKELIAERATALGKSQKSFNTTLVQLDTILKQGNIQLDLEKVKVAGNTFYIQSNEVIQAHLSTLEKEKVKELNLIGFDKQRRDFDQALTVFVESAQVTIGQREDEGRKLLMLDTATVKEAVDLLLEMFGRDLPVLYRSEQLRTYLTQLHDITKEYIAQNDLEILSGVENNFTALAQKISSRLKRLKSKLRTDSHKQSHQQVTSGFDELKNRVLAENGIFNLHRDYLQARLSIQAQKSQLNETTKHVNLELAKVLGYSKQINEDAQKTTKGEVAAALVYIGMIVCVGIIIGFAAGFIIIHSITKVIGTISHDINDGADQVATASDHISIAGQSLAEGAANQAASIEETTSSIEKMSSMTKKNTENAKQADRLMTDANQVVNKANDSMGKLLKAMEDISKSSIETSKIIKTIDEIAFQTNLLALNAAVEAARAGEAGAGFAVVADEVRNLAMRASDAANSTAELIENTVKKIGDGSDLVSITNEAFEKVARSTETVGELVAQISKASGEQSYGIAQVTDAIAEMNTIIQQNAANAEESASASEEMNAQAKHLRQFADELFRFVSGRNRG